MNQTVYAGILHDTYPDENGKEVPYVERVIGYCKGNKIKFCALPDFNTYEMLKKEFFEKVTDLKEIFTK